MTKNRSIVTKDTKRKLLKLPLDNPGRRKYNMNTKYKYMKQSTGQSSREKMEVSRSSVHDHKQTWWVGAIVLFGYLFSVPEIFFYCSLFSFFEVFVQGGFFNWPPPVSYCPILIISHLLFSQYQVTTNTNEGKLKRCPSDRFWEKTTTSSSPHEVNDRGILINVFCRRKKKIGYACIIWYIAHSRQNFHQELRPA